jgi:hypothetical protein
LSWYFQSDFKMYRYKGYAPQQGVSPVVHQRQRQRLGRLSITLFIELFEAPSPVAE